MAALDRWDSWEASLPADQASPVPLEELYDGLTMAAIDASGSQPEPSRRAGRSISAGVMAAGLLGAAAALDDDAEIEPVVDYERDRSSHRLEPVTVHLVWGDPAASIAVVRRWLF